MLRLGQNNPDPSLRQTHSDLDPLLRAMAQQFVRSSQLDTLLRDSKFRGALVDSVLFREATLLTKLQHHAVYEHFKAQLAEHWAWFRGELDKPTSQPALLATLEQLNERLDALAAYLRFVTEENTLFGHLVNETAFLWLYCESIVYQTLFYAHQTYFAEPALLKQWRTLRYPEPKELMYHLRI